MGQTQWKRVPRRPEWPSNVALTEAQQENLQHAGHEAVEKVSNRGIEKSFDERWQVVPSLMSQENQETREGIPLLQDYQADLGHWHLSEDMGTPAAFKDKIHNSGEHVGRQRRLQAGDAVLDAAPENHDADRKKHEGK